MPRQSERVEPVLHNRLAVLRAERGLSRQDLANALKNTNGPCLCFAHSRARSGPGSARILDT